MSLFTARYGRRARVYNYVALMLYVGYVSVPDIQNVSGSFLFDWSTLSAGIPHGTDNTPMLAGKCLAPLCLGLLRAMLDMTLGESVVISLACGMINVWKSNSVFNGLVFNIFCRFQLCEYIVWNAHILLLFSYSCSPSSSSSLHQFVRLWMEFHLSAFDFPQSVISRCKTAIVLPLSP